MRGANHRSGRAAWEFDALHLRQPRFIAGHGESVAIGQPILLEVVRRGGDDLGVLARTEPVVQINRNALLGVRLRARAAAAIDEHDINRIF